MNLFQPQLEGVLQQVGAALQARSPLRSHSPSLASERLLRLQSPRDRRKTPLARPPVRVTNGVRRLVAPPLADGLDLRATQRRDRLAPAADV